MTLTFGGSEINTVLPAGASVGVTSVVRPVRPSQTRRKLQLPGRDGSWDFGEGKKEDFNVEVELVLSATTKEIAFTALDAIADYFDGKEDLVFGDNPGKTYHARVYQMVTAERHGRGKIYQISITFECDA